MSAVTHPTTKPATTNQTSQILWKTAGYALEGAALVGLVVLAPHLVKSCLSPEQAQGFFLPVENIHEAIAWTATATLIWPIARHAQEAGAAINKELSALPKKVGAYFYSLFPTKNYDVKKSTNDLLYQNSLWGAAHLSSLLGIYLGSNKLFHVAGIDNPIPSLLTSLVITSFGSWWIENKVRKSGKSLVETLESSETFRWMCELTQRGWDFACSGAEYFGIGLLVGAAIPLQSTIASALQTTTATGQWVANSYPAQAVLKTATIIVGLFSFTFQGLFAGATYVAETAQRNYTTYAHPYVSESYTFAKTALFYSQIHDLCNGGVDEDAKMALDKDTTQKQTYEDLYKTYANQAKNTDSKFDTKTQQNASDWLQHHKPTYEAEYEAQLNILQDSSSDAHLQEAATQWTTDNPLNYKNLHKSWTSKGADENLSNQDRIPGLKWTWKHPEDLQSRCPHAENITQKIGYVKHLSGIAAAVWNWSRLKDSCSTNSESLSQDDQNLCTHIQEVTPWMQTLHGMLDKAGHIWGRGYAIASDPTTHKVALLALAAGVSLYWIHAFGTKTLAFLSRKEEKEPEHVEDTSALPKEEEKPEEQPQPSAPPLPETTEVEKEKEETAPVISSAESNVKESAPEETKIPEVIPAEIPKEPSSVKPLAARTWTTQISDSLSWIAKKIQLLWADFCSSCSYTFTQITTYSEELWQNVKRKLASFQKTPPKVE